MDIPNCPFLPSVADKRAHASPAVGRLLTASNGSCTLAAKGGPRELDTLICGDPGRRELPLDGSGAWRAWPHAGVRRSRPRDRQGPAVAPVLDHEASHQGLSTKRSLSRGPATVLGFLCFLGLKADARSLRSGLRRSLTAQVRGLRPRLCADAAFAATGVRCVCGYEGHLRWRLSARSPSARD